jgi:hypothetical protein
MITRSKKEICVDKKGAKQRREERKAKANSSST